MTENTKWWKKHYAKNSDKIKKKAKLSYNSMPEDDKEKFLQKLRDRTAQESPEKRVERLRKARERYLKSRNDRLAYQKNYNELKKTKEMVLESKVKKLEKKLKQLTLANGDQ
tara:strand:- start:875 stop:1210 length:336 start_codon:yes stop_codon:yes gene_type:complete